MIRHDIDAALDCRCDIPEILLDLRVALDRDERIVALRKDFLPEEHLDPALLAEQFVVLAENAAVRAPQVDLAPERRRQLHGPAIFPERAGTLVRPIMEHDEIADALPLEIALAVEFVDRRLVRRGVREQ